MGAHDSVVVKAMLLAGRSPLRETMRLYFPIYLILPAPLGPGFTQTLTEMSTTNRKIILLGSKVWPVRKADNLVAICESIVYYRQCGIHNISQTYRSPRPVMGITLWSQNKLLHAADSFLRNSLTTNKFPIISRHPSSLPCSQEPSTGC
jgi:hypothetical protein